MRVLARDAFLAEAPFPLRPGLRMGVLPIGTSDGVGRLHAGVALVRGRRAAVLGGPSLEHMRLDLTEIPDAAVGDEVVLIGEQGGDAITPDAVVAHHGHARIADLAMAVGPRIPCHHVAAD